MIPCNELRIGNYFLLDGQLHQVSMLNGPQSGTAAVGYHNGCDEAPHTCTATQAQPVPLNEELLQQAGFRYHPYFQFWQRVSNEPGALSEMDIDSDFNVIDFMRRPIVRRIGSLHQLQNVFYALNGRELQVSWQ